MDYREAMLPHLTFGTGLVTGIVNRARLKEADYSIYLPCFQKHVFYEIVPAKLEILAEAPNVDTEPPHPDMSIVNEDGKQNPVHTQAILLWCAWYLCQPHETRQRLRTLARDLGSRLLLRYYGTQDIPLNSPERQWRCGTTVFHMSETYDGYTHNRHDIEGQKMLAWWCAHIDDYAHHDERIWQSIFLSAGQFLMKSGYTVLRERVSTSTMDGVVVFGETEKQDLTHLQNETLNRLLDQKQITMLEYQLRIGLAAQVPKRPMTYEAFKAVEH